MYTVSTNGQRQQVKFESEPVHFAMTQSAPVKENFEKSEGSNKTMLYVALVFGLIVVAGSGYMIYKNYKGENEKKSSQFGYTF